MELLTTPLYSKHVALGARMVPFAGFLMPVSYCGIQEEHRAVRENAGIFDTSHMGCFAVRGVDARAFLDRVCVGPISRIKPGDALYTILCYPNGTIVDDIYVLCLGETEWRLVVNAGNRTKDFTWLQGLLLEKVQLENLSAEYGILAVQGPQAAKIVAEVLGQSALTISRNKCREVVSTHGKMVVSRTGYTGEDGFEIFPPVEVLPLLWEQLLQNPKGVHLQTCGLGCRDTLRLECGFPLYGHELSERTTLVEAGLSWTVDWGKDDFLGRETLLAQRQEPPTVKLVGLLAMEKSLPREGCDVVRGEVVVGKVTSGGMSPTLQKGIALAYIKKTADIEGSQLGIVIRGVARPFTVTKRRFIPAKS